ncbi:MAG: hypothetical protein DCC57_02645, partial [Chloroflexi bacterium]
PPIYDIVLVIDQSGSMWDCGGQGTDPDQLRVDAAHLFINYLGADAGSSRYRLALLHFGGTTRLMAPLTELRDTAAREQLIIAASNPEPIGWTNPLAALQTARDLLHDGALPGSRRVVLLMTDGEPAWPAGQPLPPNRPTSSLSTCAPPTLPAGGAPSLNGSTSGSRWPARRPMGRSSLPCMPMTWSPSTMPLFAVSPAPATARPLSRPPTCPPTSRSRSRCLSPSRSPA